MQLPYLAVSAVVPSLLLMWYFHSRDVHREPAMILWTTFALGVGVTFIISFLAMPSEWVVARLEQPLAQAATRAFFSAAVPEELGKLGVLLFFSMRRREFDEPMDGIVYGVAASLGFATLENVVYVTKFGTMAAIARAVTAVPAHAFFGATMGYYLGQARFDPARRQRHYALALAVPVLLHGLYDFPLMATGGLMQQASDNQTALLIAGMMALCSIIVLATAWGWALRVTRRLRAAQQRGDEVVKQKPPPLSRWLAWGSIIAGGLIAAIAGLQVLTILVAAVTGQLAVRDSLVAGVAVALPPSILGVALFVIGVSRLNRLNAPSAPRSEEPTPG